MDMYRPQKTMRGFEGWILTSNTVSISSNVIPRVSGANKNMWMVAAPLKAAKIMSRYVIYISVYLISSWKTPRSKLTHLPVNALKKRGYHECQRTVPCPVGSSAKRHGFGTNLRWEDLGCIGPTTRSPCCRKSKKSSKVSPSNRFCQ